MSSTTPDSRDRAEADSRVFEVDDEETGDLVEILADPTTRAVLDGLQSGPTTADALASRLDIPRADVAERLDDLADVDLVEVVDSASSTRADESTLADHDSGTVYEATERAVIEFGDRPDRLRDRPAVRAGVGVVVLAVVGAVFQWVLAPGSDSGVLFFLGGVTVLLTWLSMSHDW